MPPNPGASGLPLTPSLFVGGLRTRERVVVGVAGDGMPTSVRVLHRIFVGPKGDYVFSLPAPVKSVTPGPGTKSTPGQRKNELLWQGFSPGRRVLAAWVELRAAEAAGSLPARIRMETTVDGSPLAAGERRTGDLRTTLTIENATGAAARVFSAAAEPLSVAQALDELRGAVRRDAAAEGIFVRVAGAVRSVRMPIAVPLRVEGALTFAPGSVRVAGAPRGVVPISGRLDARRSSLRIDVRGRAVGAALPKLRLRVTLPSLAGAVTPPGGGTWVRAYRSGAFRGSGRELLERAIRLELTYARQRQFDMYLAAPDPNGPSTATFVYRTVPLPLPMETGIVDEDHGDHDVLWLVLAGIGLAVAIPAAAILWAHS